MIEGATCHFDSVSSQYGGMSYTQKFRFATLEIGKSIQFPICFLLTCPDQEDRQFDEKVCRQLQEVGCITLVFKHIDRMTETASTRARKLRSSSHRHQVSAAGPKHGEGPNIKSKLPEFDKVAEKNLKGSAKSHQAGSVFSDPDASSQTNARRLDTPQLERPCRSLSRGSRSYHAWDVFATFHFKYRSACE
jgi:hypothetical protein